VTPPALKTCGYSGKMLYAFHFISLIISHIFVQQCGGSSRDRPNDGQSGPGPWLLRGPPGFLILHAGRCSDCEAFNRHSSDFSETAVEAACETRDSAIQQPLLLMADALKKEHQEALEEAAALGHELKQVREETARVQDESSALLVRSVFTPSFPPTESLNLRTRASSCGHETASTRL
jgi:hypothetical protein